MQAQNKKKRKNLGQRLRMVRNQLGLKQVELAKKLGFNSHVPISRFERGEAVPGLETLVRLAMLAKINLHWLLTGGLSPTDLELQTVYDKAITKLAKYIARDIAHYLGEREYAEEQLSRLREKETKGVQIDPELLKIWESERAQAQAILSRLIEDRDWIDKALPKNQK